MLRRISKLRLQFVLVALIQVIVLGMVSVTPAFAVSQGQAITDKAASQSGLPYCWAGGDNNGPTHGSGDLGNGGCGTGVVGFDCSGLAKYAVYQATGISLPHGSGMDSAPGGQSVTLANLQSGDLVFFGSDGVLADFTHVGVYTGSSAIWHAPNYNNPVRTDTLAWVEHDPTLQFVGGVRYWAANAPTGTATSSVMLNGVENILIGDSTGAIRDAYWGNGQGPYENTVGNISAGLSIDKMSAQVSNGTIYLVFTHGNNLYSMAWGNGVNQSPTGEASFTNNIKALSTQFTSDGALHAYVGEGSNVWNVSWGNGTTYNKTLLTSEGAAVNAVSSLLTSDGNQNVYVGLNNGNIMHIYFTDPAHASQWQPGSIGAAVVDITSQLVNGVTNVDAATSTAVTNFRYGNGASFAQNVVGTVSSMTIIAIGTTTTLDGYQHAIAGTSTGNIVDFAWSDPTQHTTSTPEVLPGSASVVGMSVLITSGVIQANPISTSQAYNVGWANGTNPYITAERDLHVASV